jgi:hypothetical protein
VQADDVDRSVRALHGACIEGKREEGGSDSGREKQWLFERGCRVHYKKNRIFFGSNNFYRFEKKLLKIK